MEVAVEDEQLGESEGGRKMIRVTKKSEAHKEGQEAEHQE